MSNTKLGLLVLWPTFWTGFPIKLVVVLLLLAGGLHPWEGLGLEFLLVLSIPIDIWALGICARTVFLERLKVDPPGGLGLALWWKWALFSVLYLPILYLILGAVVSVAKSVTASIVELIEEHIWVVPVAEQITLELVMWGSVASIALIILVIGWLFGLGAITQRHVRASTPVEGTYQDIVSHWDLLRVPSDQPLLLTAFTGVGVVLVFLFWGFLPVSTPHPHEEYEFIDVKKVETPVVPKEVIKKTDQVLARATLTIEELEKATGSGSKEEKKVKAKDSGSVQKKAESVPKAMSSDSHSHEGDQSHKHADDGHSH